MATTKKSYGFRLSKQAEQHLDRIVTLTGMNKTAAVELAVAQLSQLLTGAGMSNEQNVINQYGKELNFDSAVNLMDDDIREQIHNDMTPCTNQVFFDAYVKAHAKKFGEDWVLDDQNPVW